MAYSEALVASITVCGHVFGFQSIAWPERVSDLFGGEFCTIKLVGHGCEPWSVRLIALHLLLEVGEAPASRGLRASTRAFSCAVLIQIIPKIYVLCDFVSINSDR